MGIVTMKFGGTSVGDADAIEQVVNIVTDAVQGDDRVVVVVSAMAGTTDRLMQSITLAAQGDKWGYLSLTDQIREGHTEAINRLMRPGPERERSQAQINKMLDQHISLCDAVNILGDLTPRVQDAAVSLGERLSSRVIAAVLVDRGLNAQPVNAGEVMVTDDHFTSATPIWPQTQQRIQQVIKPMLAQGVVPVITGFIGSTEDGRYTTLGRGGSDYSAAIFAAYLESDRFIVWTDVDGVMTTDPRIDSRAQVLPEMSYQEVGEMSYYGAKVLHPKTVQPVLSRGIPIYVRNTFNPTHPGTRITHESQASETVIKAVTSVSNVSMLTVSGAGMLGVPGIAGRAFVATANSGANILMISQASSEQSFCFIVRDDVAETVRAAVEDELVLEIQRQNVDGVGVRQDAVILTVIGAGMRGTPGVAGRVFTTLGENNINVLAIAQGSSECSISFVISEADRDRAVVRLHDLALQTR